MRTGPAKWHGMYETPHRATLRPAKLLGSTTCKESAFLCPLPERDLRKEDAALYAFCRRDWGVRALQSYLPPKSSQYSTLRPTTCVIAICGAYSPAQAIDSQEWIGTLGRIRDEVESPAR